MAKYISPNQPQHQTPPQGAEISPFPDSLLNFTNLPDKQAYVDLITAEIFNQNRAGLRAVTEELGVNIKGNCYDLNDRISRVITPDGKLVLPETVFSVGKENADFDTIQAAVDSITDASATKIVVIRIYPGVYQETVTLKPYIKLYSPSEKPLGNENNSQALVEIAPTSGSAINITSTGAYYLDGIDIKTTQLPAFAFETGYSSLATVHFSNGTIHSDEYTDAMLSLESKISYKFLNARVITKQLNAGLFFFEDPIVADLSLRASRSYFFGNILIDSAVNAKYSMDLSHCIFNGGIACYSPDTYLGFFNTFYHFESASPIELSPAGETVVQAIHSQLVELDENFPINRSGSSGAIVLNANHSYFTGDKGEGILGYNSNCANVFGGIYLQEPYFG